MQIGDLVVWDEEPKYKLSLFKNNATDEATDTIHGQELLLVLDDDASQEMTRVITLRGTLGWVYTGYLRSVYESG